MVTPKILVLPGSIRTGSYNVKLAALAVKELALTDVDVTRISLEDYPLPIYEDDLEANAASLTLYEPGRVEPGRTRIFGVTIGRLVVMAGHSRPSTFLCVVIP